MHQRNLIIVIDLRQTEEKDEEEEDDALAGEMKPSPNADTTILFVKGEGSFTAKITCINIVVPRLSTYFVGCLETFFLFLTLLILVTKSCQILNGSVHDSTSTLDRIGHVCWEMQPVRSFSYMFTPGFILDFPANNIVKFLLGFTNKGSENFVIESLDASFRYPQDFQFYIQNFTALQLGTVVPPQRQATFEYSFIPAEPMGGRPFGLVINLNYKDSNVSVTPWRLATLQQRCRPTMDII